MVEARIRGLRGVDRRILDSLGLNVDFIEDCDEFV